MASEVGICNLALSKIGEPPINSLSESSKAGRECALLYKQTRDEALQDFPWAFATKRRQLARTATDPVFGWDHAYQIPTEALRIIGVHDSEGQDLTRYAIEGEVLLCDADAVYARYVWRVTDAAKFSPKFVELVSRLLASKLAIAIADASKLAEFFQQSYLSYRESLQAEDASSSVPVEEIDFDDFLRARR